MSNDVTSPAWMTKLGNSTAKSVLALLGDYANAEGLGFPSIPTICDRTELSLRQVLRIMQVFQEIGLLNKFKVLRPSGKFVQAFQLNMSMLKSDLREPFRVAFERAQGKKSVSETLVEKENASVSETQESVCETSKSVCETLPPHPLIGGTVFEPFLNHPPTPASGGSVDSAVDQVMQACGFAATERKLKHHLRSVIEQECEKGEPEATTALAMIAAWRDYLVDADVMRFPWGVEKFFGRGYWRNRQAWPYDDAKMERARSASVGMYRPSG